MFGSIVPQRSKKLQKSCRTKCRFVEGPGGWHCLHANWRVGRQGEGLLLFHVPWMQQVKGKVGLCNGWETMCMLMLRIVMYTIP